MLSSLLTPTHMINYLTAQAKAKRYNFGRSVREINKNHCQPHLGNQGREKMEELFQLTEVCIAEQFSTYSSLKAAEQLHFCFNFSPKGDYNSRLNHSIHKSISTQWGKIYLIKKKISVTIPCLGAILREMRPVRPAV